MKVPWDDLSDAEQSYHQDRKDRLNIQEYCQLWERNEGFGTPDDGTTDDDDRESD